MRKMIKRLLKKYKYPPEEAANALETVIRQCEQWTDNDDSEPLYQKAPKKYEFPESSSYTIAAEPNSKYNNICITKFSHLQGIYRVKLSKSIIKNTVLLTRCITYLCRSLGYSGGINPPHGNRTVISRNYEHIFNIFVVVYD